jgi:hypothetical protein
MFHKSALPILVVFIFALSACTFPLVVTPTASVPTSTVAVPISTLPGGTVVPAPSATVAPTVPPIPTPTVSVVPVSIPTSPNYIDDRSTPSQLIISLFNAVSRKEYLRAYNYWINPGTSLGSFTAYADGYKDTGSVDLVFGNITGDAGAGQMYYTVPVILKATATNGVHANYAACYIVHLSQPGFFGAPPFDPMGISQGNATNIALNADDATVLSTACNGLPIGFNPISVAAETLNIDKNNYLDNRSGAIETVSSMLNALNLKQYVRAYYYFQVPATYPGDYTVWSNGFSNTDNITVTFGTVQQEGAAGSLYYKVPLSEVVTTTSATTQTFVGCYTLRLGQPANQMTPPFQPMGIISGTFTQVANGTNIGSLLLTACP